MNRDPANGVWLPPGLRTAQWIAVWVAVLATAWESTPLPPLPVPAPVLLAIAVLVSERVRVPFQNTVAIAVLSSVSGLVAAWATAPRTLATRGALCAASIAVVAVPGARALLRQLRRGSTAPRGWELPALTAALAVPAWELGRAWWAADAARTPTAIAIDWTVAAVASFVLQAALTPWWVDKRRIAPEANPLAAIPWIAFAIAALVRAAWLGV